MLLDCCGHTWPFKNCKRRLGDKRGLGQADGTRAMSTLFSIGGVMVGFAAGAAVAESSLKQVPGHSPYTAALLLSFTAAG